MWNGSEIRFWGCPIPDNGRAMAIILEEKRKAPVIIKDSCNLCFNANHSCPVYPLCTVTWGNGISIPFSSNACLMVLIKPNRVAQ